MKFEFWISLIAIIISFLSIFIAYLQFQRVKKIENLRTIFEIERLIMEKYEIYSEVGSQEKSKESIDQTRVNIVTANYYSTIELLSLLILKKYLPEKEWKDNYCNVIMNALEAHGDFLNERKKYYPNLLKLHEKWSSKK